MLGKAKAKAIIEQGVTWDELRHVLVKARADGAADDSVSVVNSSFSKAAMFNIMAKDIDYHAAQHTIYDRIGSIVATHILREFGGYVDGNKYKLPQRKPRPTVPKWHEEPIEFG